MTDEARPFHGIVTITDGSLENWFVITDERGQRINNADIEGDRDEMLMIALAIMERRLAGESFKRCAVWPDGDGFCLQSPRNSMRATRISSEQATALARDIRLHFAPPATDATTLALEAQTAELAKLREENERWRRIDSDVNAAINRAGIHCAITFAEAIDQIAAERDRLRGELDVIDRDRDGHPQIALIRARAYAAKQHAAEQESLRKVAWDANAELQKVVWAAVAWRETWRHRAPFGDEKLAVALVDAVDVFTGVSRGG